MTNEKPNYRIEKYPAESSQADIVSSASLRKGTETLQDKTFCLLNSTSCSSDTGCECNQECPCNRECNHCKCVSYCKCDDYCSCEDHCSSHCNHCACEPDTSWPYN